MKKYYNATTKEWYNEGNSLTRKIDNGVFIGIPSVEQLTQWGFEEWIEPAPTPMQLLEQAKQKKLLDIESYDLSSEVNGFDVKLGNETFSAWLTPEKRADYKNSLDSAELLGMEEVHPVLNGVILSIPTQTAKIALAKIQIYANQCYGVTEKHKAEVDAFTSIEDVEAYEYKKEYPERLMFEL